MEEQISIIVPVYNVEMYLTRCINSIINQTYKNIELLLIDDGSTDLSGNICDEYSRKDKRIKVVHCKNQGVSEARNKGLEMASGEWIGFVDPDDWIDKDMYESLYKMVKLYNADISVCAHRKVNTFGKYIMNKKDDEYELLDNKMSMKYMLVDNLYCGAVWNKLYKKSILINNKFKKNMIIGEDVLFNFNLLYNTKINTIYNKNPKYNYFYRDNSVMNNKNFDRKILSQLEVRKEIYNLIKDDNKYSFFIKEYKYKYFRVLINLLLKVCQENSEEHKCLYNELIDKNKKFLKMKNVINKKEYIYIIVFSLPYIISNKIILLWNFFKGCNKS